MMVPGPCIFVSLELCGLKQYSANLFSFMATNCKMNRLIHRIFNPLLLILSIGCKTNNADWPVYKADNESSSYSHLDQVNTRNVHQLTVAWKFSPNDAMPGSRFGSSECNPIIIDGVMYASSARHRIYAVNAESGRLIWSFDPFNGEPGGGVYRGVTYWESGADKRILFTAGDNLFALNALTGKLIPDFGEQGKVSMNVGIRDDPKLISVKPTSPGIVFGDLLILGNEVSELYGAQPGYIRAYNIRNGKLEWTFHTIPKPGEPGYETWPPDAWKYAGGANDWSGMSLDKKRGMVFLALGSPSYDFYGADRKGINLYGNCVVALDASNGKLRWYFQTIHHDLWDYDLPAPPNLVTLTKDGKRVDAVAQTSKIGFLYVLDRETGTPLFPVEETKVPASDVPGEEAWPTQPFPLKPKPYARQYMTEDDLSNFSPAAHDSLVKVFRGLRYEGLFTPPSVKGTLNLPGTIGGSEWGGAAYDPATSVLYLKSNESPEIDILQKVEAGKKGTADTDPYSSGLSLYKNFCASCHREDRNGNEPVYPSLVDLNKRMSKDQVLNKIRQGGGKMPPFESIIKGHEEAIIAYLFDHKKRLSQKEADLLEIQNNFSAVKQQAKDSSTKDSATTYLNLTAYAQFEGIDGYSAIKPPWGTLNAIDLNTGEYNWTIPVGNFPQLQGAGDPPTGSSGSPGPIVTAGGLVFVTGTKDNQVFAFDKSNGKLLWQYKLPAIGSATPCTYMVKGKQYIAMSVRGDKESPSGYIIAFALPAH
jgi:quinoprotein glucose dehydrogenase